MVSLAMSGEAQLMLMIAGIHLLGLGCVAVLMLPALRDTPLPPPSESGPDDGWGKGPKGPPTPPDSPRGGLPLPDEAELARIRLRDDRRLYERIPKRERRTAHDPRREPVRVRTRS